MTEHEKIVQVFRQLGAADSQAETMALQVEKRAGQMAAERSISRVEAMKFLLEAVIKGHQGETPGPAPGTPPT